LGNKKQITRLLGVEKDSGANLGVFNKMSNSDGNQKISVQELKESIKKSGYLIEQRVESIIKERGYYVQANSVFRDEETGKSREIDLEALAGIQIYRKGYNFLFPYIICECENNSQPVVFFQREMFTDLMFHDEFKCSGIPVKYWKEDCFVSLSEFMGLEKFHHYCKGPFATQYCTFEWVKKKKSWIAKHSDEQHDTFLSLIKSLNFNIDEHFNWWTPPEKEEEEFINIQIYYPVIVLQGDLRLGYLENNNLITKKVSHVQFRKQYISSRGPDIYAEAYLIDVINEKYLPKFLDIIDKEIEAIKKMFSRKKKDVEIAMQKIVTEAKKKKKNKESHRDILEF